MPARLSARSSHSSGSRQTAKSRASALSIPEDETPSTSLRVQICAIFGDAYRSTAGHRKLVVGLRKIQESCCYEPPKSKKQNRDQEEDFDESDFNQEVERCVMRMLFVKKAESAGDRLVRFLGLFLKQATDADNLIFQEQDPEALQGVPETPTSRLASQILSFVVSHLAAKDKVIRFRSTQIIAHLINTLDSVDDTLFDHLRLGLLKRLRDRESTVRVQAVNGLGRLAGEVENEQQDDDSDDDSAGGVLGKLLDVLQNDPSADVRRSLLLNLPFTPGTLPFLLERARDSDPSIRRALYSRLLPALGDFRHLSLTHREKLLRWGLRDRDENVRKATARLFRERWIEDCAREPDAEDDGVPGQLAAPSSEGLFELLERIDVVNAGVDGGIALDAMKDFWDGRPDYLEFMTFDEAYWRQLTPESVFVVRTFNDFCQNNPGHLANDKMPEVTRLAFLLQENINRLVENVRAMALQDDNGDAEETSVQQEFIVEQLLHIALTLDFSDEMGRRKMLSLMREALALAELPEESTRLVVEVLRTVCGLNANDERDFCGIVLEAIAEVHDTIMGEEPEKKDEEDESFHSAKSELTEGSMPPKSEEMDEEKAIREIMVNLKCLHIAQCMLQNVDCNLEQNVHLVTMLNNLVVPAVRSQEAPIRERGLLCLGLCCLLEKKLSEENLTLFLHCFNKGHEALQNIAIQIIGDILTAHPSHLLAPSTSAPDVTTEAQESSSLHKPIHKLFSKALKSPSAPIQSTACTALCKLMLSTPSSISTGLTTSILNTDDLLRLLTVAYFDSQTADNPALRQALTYFLPVYCHSRKENMQRMGRIALGVLHWCMEAKEEIDIDVEEDSNSRMVGLSVVVSHLVDWTDGRKLISANATSGNPFSSGEEGAKEASSDVHLDIAAEILEKVLGSCPRDEKKLYLSMLSKLYVSPSSDVEKLKVITELVNEAVDAKIAADATTRNALTKLQTTLTKATANTDQTRSDSRGRSSALSSGEDAGETSELEQPAVAQTFSIDGAELALQARSEDTTELQTPMTSPRKRANGRSKAPIEPSTPDITANGLDEDEDTIMGDAPPALAADSEAELTTMLESSLLASEPPTPALTTMLESSLLASEPPTPAPERTLKPTAQPRPRSQPARKTIASVRQDSEDDLNMSEMTDELMQVEEKPMARTRGKPTKAPLAALPQAPARRSVRSSRRKTEALDDSEI